MLWSSPKDSPKLRRPQKVVIFCYRHRSQPSSISFIVVFIHEKKPQRFARGTAATSRATRTSVVLQEPVLLLCMWRLSFPRVQEAAQRGTRAVWRPSWGHYVTSPWLSYLMQAMLWSNRDDYWDEPVCNVTLLWVELLFLIVHWSVIKPLTLKSLLSSWKVFVVVPTNTPNAHMYLINESDSKEISHHL